MKESYNEFLRMCSLFHNYRMEYCVLNIPADDTPECYAKILARCDLVKEFHNILTREGYNATQGHRQSNDTRAVPPVDYKGNGTHIELLECLTGGRKGKTFVSDGMKIVQGAEMEGSFYRPNKNDEVKLLLLQLVSNVEDFIPIKERLEKVLPQAGETECLKSLRNMFG